MTDNEKELVKSHLLDYLDRVTTKKDKKYICPFCGSGTGHKGTPAFNIVPDTQNTKYYCHSCGANGDIFDLYSFISGANKKAAFKELGEMFLGSPSSSWNANTRPARTEKAKQQPQEETQIDYTEFYKTAHKNINKTGYLLKRGISAEVQDRFNIGYVQQWKHPKTPKAFPTNRIIIPTSKNSYLARYTGTAEEIPAGQQLFFNAKLKVGKTHIFNIADLEKEYCFIVEGEIDALSVIECGYPCVALGSVAMMNRLLNICISNKKSIGTLIFALDTDKAGEKANGKIPEFINNGIRCACISVSGAEKDPNDLLIKNRKELEMNLHKAVEEAKKIEIIIPEELQPVQPEQVTERSTEEQTPHYFYLNDKGEMKINAALLAEYIRRNNNYIFVRNEANESVMKYWYRNGVYTLISDNELKGLIKEHITKYSMLALKMRDVKEVYDNLTTDLNFVSGHSLNDNENIINFQNGLLYLDTMELKPHDPKVYSTIQIPCNYNKNALNAPTFERFINEFTSGNEEKRRFLLQFIAVCVSNIRGNKFKKSLFMVGPGNTGKSQLKKLTEKIIGLGNCSSITLETLETRFGTSGLYNKRLVGDSDMSFMSVKELKMFKQITGGDCIQIEFKGRTPFEYMYNGLTWFCMNELPHFGGDRGDWVYDRIAIIKCDNVIPEEKRDPELIDKLFDEREQIINAYILPALQEVIRNGYRFNVPEECSEELQAYKIDNNPVHKFYEECCTERTTATDNCDAPMMYKIFKEWCKDNNGGYIISKHDFNKELVSALNVSNIKEIQKTVKGTRYFKFTINQEVKNEYRNIYGFDNVTDSANE